MVSISDRSERARKALEKSAARVESARKALGKTHKARNYEPPAPILFEQRLLATLPETAKYLQCTIDDVNAYIQSRDIRYLIIGDDVRVIVKDVVALKEYLLHRVLVVNEPKKNIYVNPIIISGDRNRGKRVPIYYENATDENKKLFYVYLLIRPDGGVFYVGKGTNQRVHAHEKEAKRGCKCYKCNVIRSVWKNGGEIIRNIVFQTNKEEEAYQVEARFIEQLKGTLTNIKPGEQRWMGLRKKRYYWRTPADKNAQEMRQFWAQNKVAQDRQDDLLAQQLDQEYKDLNNRRKAARMHGWDIHALDDQLDWIYIALAGLGWARFPEQLTLL